MLAWQNRPQVIVGKYIKRCLGQWSPSGDSPNGNSPRQAVGGGGPGVQWGTPNQLSTSPANTASYEDEIESKLKQLNNKGNRVRYDSLGTIAGVRFDS